jgi:serine phosphatase RsbU (regulator of sigma subunit)/anti-sigma regulatory factor (Ser/Thr protein kinase)
MFRRPIKEINAEFLAEEKYLDRIQQIVREACAAAGMARKQTTAVLLAVEEGATNIIRHAYLYEKGTLRIRIVIYRRMIAISLIDTGRSFQPDRHGTIDLEKLVESGRRGGIGFYMVQKIMDSVQYISSADSNELRMIKRIEGEAVQSPPLLRRMFNLRVKFSFFTLAIVTIIVGVAYYYISTRTVHQLYDHLDATARALATTVADQAAGYVINRRSDVEFDRLTVSYQKSNPFLRLIVITDTANIVLAHSDDIRNIRKPYDPPISLSRSQTGQPRRISVRGEELNYLVWPIHAGARELGHVHLMYSSDLIKAELASSHRRTLFLTLALLGVGIIGIYLLSSYFVTPILKITQRVRRFSSGDLDTELPLEGADEFFEISRALNDMTTRLSRDRKNVIERERMAKEIEVASQIQQTLLPRKLPDLPGLEVDTFYRAASMVGGDLYDVFQIDEHHYCLVVADVSGKGVPASLVMSMLRTVIQIQARNASSAGETLLQVNEYLMKNAVPGMFITVLLALYDAESRRLEVVSAGHNPLLLYRAGSRQVKRVNPSGMPLGVPSTLDQSFAESLESTEIHLQAGDIVLLYTDGITEATNRDGKQYGLDRLADFIEDRLRDGEIRPVSEISRGIIDEIDNFSGFAKQNDDITFIIARTCTEDEDRSSGESALDRVSVEKLPEDPSH